MATYGIEKWTKYFSKGNIATTVKSTKPVPIYALDSETKIDTLPPGHEIIVPVSEAFYSKFIINYYKKDQFYVGRISNNNVAKPIENIDLVAEDLIEGGKEELIVYNDKSIPCRSFYHWDELAYSILQGLKKHKEIRPVIINTFSRYFESPDLTTIKWNPKITRAERYTLGVCLSELLVGVLMFKNFLKLGKGSPVKFMVPVDRHFNEVDSFVKFKGQPLVPISAKFGSGAKASIFASIVPAGIALINDGEIWPPSVFQGLCNTAINNNIKNPERQSKEIVYNYGIKSHLKIEHIQDVMSIYNSLLQSDSNGDTGYLIKTIQERDDVPDIIKESVKQSVTAYFCRAIADQLNNDPASISQIKHILLSKNFWQASLRIDPWLRGEVSYRAMKAEDADLKIIGNKSPVKSIRAKQGTINYQLKFKE